jgi:hypothetical protein
MPPGVTLVCVSKAVVALKLLLLNNQVRRLYKQLCYKHAGHTRHLVCPDEGGGGLYCTATSKFSLYLLSLKRPLK